MRKNVRYRVEDAGRYSKQREKEIIKELVGWTLAESEEGKVIIYCNTIPKVEDLVSAELFNCDGFYSKVKNRRKKEILEDFRKGSKRVVITTSALGIGVDIPDIRLIVHADKPRNLLDYAQESRRAGRDGLPSRAVIIGWQGKAEEGKKDKLVERLIGKGGIECRRVVMSEYLDGRFGRVEYEDREEKCNVYKERERGRGEEE